METAAIEYVGMKNPVTVKARLVSFNTNPSTDIDVKLVFPEWEDAMIWAANLNERTESSVHTDAVVVTSLRNLDTHEEVLC